MSLQNPLSPQLTDQPEPQATGDLTTLAKMKGLPWGIGFNVANTFFVQFTYFGSVFVLYLDALGLNKSQIGFMLSLFPFLGLLSLFIAPAIARHGYKRTFLLFFGLRNFFTLGLLLTPIVLAYFSAGVVLAFTAGVTIAFSVAKAVAFTAYLPWQQECIPNSIRGKYTAASNIFVSVAGILAVSFASYIVGASDGLGSFLLLFGLGVGAGFFSVWLASHIPGGAPDERQSAGQHNPLAILSSLRDRSFFLYLVGTAFITLAVTPIGSFIPLFMQERVGLQPGNIVLLQTFTMIGGLVSSYVWGWASDRYGSKPVMQSGVYLLALLPLFWLLMPKGSPLSLPLAMAIAFYQGLATMGWTIGSGRLLYVRIVPEAKGNEYLAVYNAWIGVMGGSSQLLGGQLLQRFAGFEGHLFTLPVDSYSLLFGIAILLPALAGLIFRVVRADSTVSMGKFAGMLVHGNPLMAVESMIRFHLAKDEQATISMTERLGATKSPLTVEELLEALSDPRFYVRFEALVSIARRDPDERLLEALVGVLKGNDPALSVIAAWALGRIGDSRALDPLRAGMHSPYRSVQAHAVRSLANLGDELIVPEILARMAHEKDPGLLIAYASSLGKLGIQQAVPRILDILDQTVETNARTELALALARIVSNEHDFIQLNRSARDDPGTHLSRAVSGLKKNLDGESEIHRAHLAMIDDSAEALARQDLQPGLAILGKLAGEIQASVTDPAKAAILRACSQQLIADTGRLEYALLALLILGA
jgi:HEAT repeat protein/predicted MFS family arabinose efflux permease